MLIETILFLPRCPGRCSKPVSDRLRFKHSCSSAVAAGLWKEVCRAFEAKKQLAGGVKHGASDPALLVGAEPAGCGGPRVQLLHQGGQPHGTGLIRVGL